MTEMTPKERPPQIGTGAEIRSRAARVGARQTKPPRDFNPAFRARILREVDEARASGEKGALAALLRREGITRSNLWHWERARERDEKAAASRNRRGRPRTKNPLADTVASLEREVERLKKDLYKAEVVIDVQKKLSSLLGIAMPKPPEDDDKP
jgi:transposase